MNISEISSTNAYSVNNSNDDPLSMKAAIKAYKDEWLTGLTDEELAEIEKEAKLYLEKYPIKTDSDRDAFNAFIKSLLKKFGYKGDLDEYAASIGAAAELSGKEGQGGDSGQPAKSNPAALYQMEALGSMSAKNKLLS